MNVERLQVEVIKCVHCGKWNYPTISDDGTISYPNACQNRDCRRLTYAGQIDKRQTPEFKAKMLPHLKKVSKFPRTREPIKRTYADFYKK